MSLVSFNTGSTHTIASSAISRWSACARGPRASDSKPGREWPPRPISAAVADTHFCAGKSQVDLALSGDSRVCPLVVERRGPSQPLRGRLNDSCTLTGTITRPGNKAIGSNQHRAQPQSVLRVAREVIDPPFPAVGEPPQRRVASEDRAADPSRRAAGDRPAFHRPARNRERSGRRADGHRRDHSAAIRPTPVQRNMLRRRASR